MTASSDSETGEGLSKQRIEALSDGIFAFAMTLLVLDVKVPKVPEPLVIHGFLAQRLLALWPKFLSFAMSFVILGLFPLAAKKVLAALKSRKVYARWKRPAAFDRNLVVIGAGSAGLVSAYIAAAVKAKVTLIEKGAMGGDCLNTGCVPSKALIRSAKLLADMRRARDFGIRVNDTEETSNSRWLASIWVSNCLYFS